MTEHTLTVPRTARYVTLSPPAGEPVDEVWLVCHGYGQLAARFARHFQPLVRPGRLVVAPEGLSRFYLDARYQRVGASWATRELRDAEVDDQVRFLDDALVAACVAHGADPRTVRLVAMGFSQGTATVGRWLARSPLAASRQEAGTPRAHRLVVWGGRLPDDLDLAEARPWLSAADVVLVAGERDPIATPARVMAQERRLDDASVPYRTVAYDGEHRLNARVLAALGRD